MKKEKTIEKIIKEHQQISEKIVVKRTHYFEWLLVTLSAAFGILAFYAKQIPYFPLDLYITQTVQQISVPGFKELMILLTILGEFEWGVVTIILLSIFFLALKKNINAIYLIVSVSGATALSVILKSLVARPRPNPELITQLGEHLYSDSFPSGHVLYYLGTYGFLLYLSFTKLKHGALRNFFIVFFSLMLLLIGISRIYVGAHWFTDTVGAYLIGTAWLLVVIHIYSRFGKKDA